MGVDVNVIGLQVLWIMIRVLAMVVSLGSDWLPDSQKGRWDTNLLIDVILNPRFNKM
jgi:hypothetical protein